MTQPTYESIFTYTVSSTDTTITFDNIPATFTDLRIAASEKYTGSTNSYIRFNSDSGSNYSKIVMYANSTYGANVSASRETNQTQTYIHAANGTSSIPRYTTIDIMNYLATGTNYKSLLFTEGSPDDYWGKGVALYRGGSAISRIDLTVYQSSWSVGSVFTLYGIKRYT